jgi:iron(III) transport system permease protein
VPATTEEPDPAAAYAGHSAGRRVNGWLRAGRRSQGSRALVVLLLALPALLPLLATLAAWLTPATEVWAHQARHVLPRVAFNSLLLVAMVGTLSALLGAGLAWLVAAHEFPGRRHFAWALLLPLAVPGYVLAVVFAGSLDYAGPVQNVLRERLGFAGSLPGVRSLGGAALVLSLTLFPYVYLLARNAFESSGGRALEVAQSLGLTRAEALRRVLLPAARPAIAAGVALVCMESLADFGVVAAFNVDTFTTAIYKAWFGLFSVDAALQMAGLLALLALAVLAVERRLRGGAQYASSRVASAIVRARLTGWRAALAFAAAAGVLALAFVLPFAQLLAWALRHAATDLDQRYWGFAARSLLLASSGTLIVLAAAVALGYALRDETRRPVRAAGRLALSGYAMPGAVLAIGVFVPVVAVARILQSWLDASLGPGVVSVVTAGTIVAMLLAYLARFLAVGHGPIESGLARIHRHIDECAESLGTTGFARLSRIHLPLLRGSLLAGGALVFVDLMKELPITLMTRPFGFETLAVRVFEMAAEGEWERAALPSVLLVLVGLVPIVLLGRRVASVA